ncbi:MAG: hypothetical protein K8R75_01200, partial [Deltaproteobacteria bacterium]|nr:hypothetical protein [Deltaproteobacteria bacterium]
MNEKRLSKTEWKRLEKDLCRSRRPVWSQITAKDRKKALLYSDKYKDFISKAKTERESVNIIASKAQERGFVPFEQAGPGSNRVLWTF